MRGTAEAASCGPRFALARVRCPAHPARPGLGPCPTRRTHASDPWRSTPPHTPSAPPPTDPVRSASSGAAATASEPGNARLYFLFFLSVAGRHRNCPKAGWWGWVGVLSAMDGAKQGPQERLLPSPTQAHHPAIPRADQASHKRPSRSPPFRPTSRQIPADRPQAAQPQPLRSRATPGSTFYFFFPWLADTEIVRRPGGGAGWGC